MEDFMRIRKLQNLDGNLLVESIKEVCARKDINCALGYLKKSGICIDTHGSGKIRKQKTFKKAIEIISKSDEDSSQVKEFIKEVNILNNIYKDFNQDFMMKIENKIPKEEHFAGYLAALELELRLLYKAGADANIVDLLIESTGMVLNYFNYKGISLQSSSLEFKNKTLNDATEHFAFGAKHRILSKIYELWSYYDVPLTEEKGVYYMNAIGNTFVQAKNISHMTFFDKRIAKMGKDTLEDLLSYSYTYRKRPILPPEHYNTSNERTSGDFLMRYLSIDNLDFHVNNIPVSILLRAYTVLEEESYRFLLRPDKNKSYITHNLGNICLILSEAKWRKKFELAGIPYKYIKKVIEFMTFSKGADDLFNAPFIKLENENKLLILPSISIITDASRAILLHANSKKNINLGKKGTTFEDVILDSLMKHNIKCFRKKKHHGGNTYECDAIFYINETLYLVEIKNWTIPTTYEGYAKYSDDLKEAVDQHEKTVEFYLRKENLDEILKELNNPNIERIKKIILTNVPFGGKLIDSDIYVLDDVMFLKYFERNSPLKVETRHNIVNRIPICNELYEGEITDQQFNKFIEETPFLEYQRQRLEELDLELNLTLNIKLKDYTFKNMVVEENRGDLVKDNEEYIHNRLL